MYNFVRQSAESILYKSFLQSSVAVVKSTRLVTTHSSLPVLYCKISILGFYPCRRYHTVKGKLARPRKRFKFCFREIVSFYTKFIVSCGLPLINKARLSTSLYSPRVLATDMISQIMLYVP